MKLVLLKISGENDRFEIIPGHIKDREIEKHLRDNNRIKPGQEIFCQETSELQTMRPEALHLNQETVQAICDAALELRALSSLLATS